MSQGDSNPAATPHIAEDVQGDGRWMSQVSLAAGGLGRAPGAGLERGPRSFRPFSARPLGEGAGVEKLRPSFTLLASFPPAQPIRPGLQGQGARRAVRGRLHGAAAAAVRGTLRCAGGLSGVPAEIHGWSNLIHLGDLLVI